MTERALGALEYQVSGSQAQPAVNRPVSSAPAPISPLGGAGTRSTMPLDAENYQDYNRRREAEIRARRHGRYAYPAPLAAPFPDLHLWIAHSRLPRLATSPFVAGRSSANW